MSSSKYLMALALSALLSPLAFAGASSGYLCASDQPFDHFSVIDGAGASAVAFWLAGDPDVVPLDGRIPPGQSPVLESRNGLMIVPSTSIGRPVVDIYFRQKRVARLPGSLQGADIGGVRGQLALVTATRHMAPGSDLAEVVQSVVATNGRVLASRRFNMRLNEDDARQFRLTERGDGIYRVPSENNPAEALKVLDVLTFSPRLSITGSRRLAFTDVWMQSAHEGFAIGNGRMFRIADGSLEPMTTLEEAFRATGIVYDPRADRVLVTGTDGFRVFDGRGRKLMGQQGLSSVRLTIEGHVVEVGEGGKARLWRRDDGYAEPQPLSVDAVSNWHAIACMTAHSAATMERDAAGERGRLVRLDD